MSNKVKFRFTQHQRAATLNTGTEVVEIEDNCAWLSPSDAKAFLDNKLGKIEEGKLPEVEAGEPQGDEGATEPPQGDEGSVDNKELMKALLIKTVDELRSLAVDSGLPEAEWKGLTKPNLVNYLIEKAFNKPE